MFMGPLPPPDLLAQYNALIPDGADRLMKLTEGQSAHRQRMERSALNHEMKRSILGLYAALGFGLVMLLAAFLLIWSGKSIEGFVLVAGEVSAGVGIFVYGDTRRREERRERFAQANRR